MELSNRLQAAEIGKGGNMNNTTIPFIVLKHLEEDMKDMIFGSVTLEIKFHDGRPTFNVIKTVSIIPGKIKSGG